MGWITPERVRVSCDPETLLPGARSFVALGTAYEGQSAQSPGRSHGGEPAAGEGRVARYAWGRDYHDVIPPRLSELASFIGDLFGPPTRSRCFVDTGPLLDRAVAARAGLGFEGKNTCILTGPHGSYLFLSAILTTADLPADPLVTRDCGTCRACLDACPTEALVAPGELDATRCISYLTIEHRGSIARDLRPRMGSWVFGCDVCQEVCPWNRARRAADHPEFGGAAGVGPTVDPVELLALNDEAFRVRFKGTALIRPKRAGLLRNAAVSLGNLGDGAATPALLAALDDPEPVVREHAAWALGRLGPLGEAAQAEILARLEQEDDVVVRGELRRLLGGEHDRDAASR